MHSLASAAQLLAKCSSIEQLPTLLTGLGFSQTLAPLTSDAEASLALPSELTDVRISRNKGSLRALAWTVQGGDMRASLQQVAARLNARASQLLWLLVSVDPHRRELALAALDSGGAVRLDGSIRARHLLRRDPRWVPDANGDDARPA